jgi:NADH-quinone oxidoreductase subunit C
MAGSPLVDRLKQRFGDQIKDVNLEAIDPWIEVAPSSIADVSMYLRDEPDMKFDMLECISGVDYFEPDEKKAAKTGWDPHIEVVYHLWSVTNKTSLVLKVVLPRWKDGKPGSLPEVESVAEVWPTADWHERETYDLVGIRFLNHPNLRRILCPEDWVGHALRKDYEMPLEYHGIRGR